MLTSQLRVAILVAGIALLDSAALADSPENPKAEQSRVDLYGDPLPEGAIARLGSLRFYHGKQTSIDRVVMSPDGSRIISVSRAGNRILWDAKTGQELSLRDELKQGIGPFATKDKLLTLIQRKAEIFLWDLLADKALASLSVGIPTDQATGPFGLCPQG